MRQLQTAATGLSRRAQRLRTLNPRSDPLGFRSPIRDHAMPKRRTVMSVDERARYDHMCRLRRFGQQFERLRQGERVQSYDAKWLAYVRDRQS